MKTTIELEHMGDLLDTDIELLRQILNKITETDLQVEIDNGGDLVRFKPN